MRILIPAGGRKAKRRPGGTRPSRRGAGIGRAAAALVGAPFALAALGLLVAADPAAAQDGAERDWPVHSEERPRPPVVGPGPAAAPTVPPSDAIILFNGTNLDAWQGPGGNAPGWRIADGYAEVEGGTGSITTRREFGDIQLHVEWAAPVEVDGDGQGRGNSGVFLMGRYEVQVLDSWENDTYPDGQNAALYGQEPPMVNASRPPGEWQTFDIVFRAPRFGAGGELLSPARVTVLHNGVLVHDAVEFHGLTVHGQPAQYEAHPETGPIMLQDHGDAVRFRSVWVRELR